jgi:YegS/Rv2252/BmrU family lipid kinase
MKDSMPQNDAPAWFFIINPYSGGAKALRQWPKLKQALVDSGIAFTYQFTDEREHAVELSRQASLDGYRYFVAVGGDGTANEVLQGLATSGAAPLAEHFFAVIPWGTGNDWSAMHNIPHDIKGLCALLKNPQFTAHDIGIADYCVAGSGVVDGGSGVLDSGMEFSQRRYFLNFVGTGFDAYLLQKMGAASGKRWKYYQALLQCLCGYTSPRFTINGQQHSYSLMLMCCIGKFGGAGMQFAPDAKFDDGLFDIINIQEMSVIQRVLSLPILMNGKIKQHGKVEAFVSSTLTIECNEPFQFQCDGELVGELPVRISMQPVALNVLCNRNFLACR